MKHSKHPAKSKYLYKSETNGSVYNIITKLAKGKKIDKKNDKNEYSQLESRVFGNAKLKLFDDIVNRELWKLKEKK
jgi:hypothetical protein